MKVLLAYTTKAGNTKECIDRLHAALSGMDVETANLESIAPDPRDYDILVLGASVRFGRLSKAFTSYLSLHEETILQKPHALFLCCGLAHEYEYYIERFYSKELRDSAFLIENFGGTLNYKNRTLFEKLIIHRMRSDIRESEIEDGEYTPEFPGILPENIGKTATYIRVEAEKLLKREKN